MPGGIFTNLQRHVGGGDYMEQAKVRFADAGVRFKTPEQGAATSVLLAALAGGRRGDRSLLRGLPRGARHRASARRRRWPASRRTPSTRRTPQRLWEVSLDLTGLR